MTEDEFVGLVENESGMALTVDDMGTDLDALVGWDSVHLLKLLSALERAGATRLPVVEVLQARSLGQIHALVSG